MRAEEGVEAQRPVDDDEEEPVVPYGGFWLLLQLLIGSGTGDGEGGGEVGADMPG